MKKYYILFLTLFCLPLWAGAFSLPETEKLFEDGNFAVAEKQYEQLLSSTAGNDLLQVKLRLAACQYNQGKYLTAAQTSYGF